MAICQFYGADALLLDLFPFSGNSAAEEPGIGKLLDECRPGLEWIGRRFRGGLPALGVGIPFRQDAAERVRTAAGRSMDELWVRSLSPSEYLVRYGVPVSMREQPVNAIFGDMAWAFDDEEVRRMLSGGLLLDGQSAWILCRRGFSRHLGVQVKTILGRFEHNYSLEAVTAGGLPARKGLYFNSNKAQRMAVVRPLGGAREWTEIITAEPRRVGSGMVAFTNSLGGRVMTLAACDPGGALAMSFQRQALVHHAVEFLSGGQFASPLVTGAAHLLPAHFRARGSDYVAVFNESGDSARPVVTLPRGAPAPAGATLLAPLSKPASARVRWSRVKGRMVGHSQILVPNLGCLVLRWR